MNVIHPPRRYLLLASLAGIMALICLAPNSASALQGAFGMHDPSRIIKDASGTYHIWFTGQGIGHSTSKDLANWTSASSVFSGNGPNWVTNYAPGFTGFFWAPDVIKKGSTYYMYWSAAGANQGTCIGLATSTDLNTWTDQGVIVYSVNGSPFLAIDACPFTDASGNLWMTFGSHLSGIYVMTMDTNGKGIGSTLRNIASSGTSSEHEGPYCFYKNGYYWLFWQRGYYLDATNYNIQMARGSSPQGPFYDKNGKNVLGTGAGSPFASTATYFRSPCHLGYFQDSDGTEYATYSTWDDTYGGASMLFIANLTWVGGWPWCQANWVNSGTYKIQNAGNGLVWDDWGCGGGNGDSIAQNTYWGGWCQQWTLSQMGNGVYKFALANGRVADVINCSSSVGAKLDVYDWTGAMCQQWKVDRYANGNLCIQSVNGMFAVDVPNATTNTGTQLQLWYGNGIPTQQWKFLAP